MRIPDRISTRFAPLKPLLLLTLWALARVASASPETSVYAVKAAYLYKFASYVEWPEGSFSRRDSPLVIGIIGADEMAGELEQIVAGQAVAGHGVQVRKLRRGESLSGIHIVFIGHVDDTLTEESLAAAHGQPILTVTESETDYAQGSMINLVIADNRIRFEVALTPVELGHLKISARMLTAATSVSRRSP